MIISDYHEDNSDTHEQPNLVYGGPVETSGTSYKQYGLVGLFVTLTRNIEHQTKFECSPH